MGREDIDYWVKVLEDCTKWKSRFAMEENGKRYTEVPTEVVVQLTQHLKDTHQTEGGV